MVGSLIVGGVLTHILLYSLSDFKATQGTILIKLIMLYKFKLGHNAKEMTKNVCCAKGECSVMYEMIQEIFAQITITSTIRQGHKDPKPWIPRLCSKLYRQIWQEALGEYQVNMASDSPVWFVTIMILVKAPRTAELCLT